MGIRGMAPQGAERQERVTHFHAFLVEGLNQETSDIRGKKDRYPTKAEAHKALVDILGQGEVRCGCADGAKCPIREAIERFEAEPEIDILFLDSVAFIAPECEAEGWESCRGDFLRNYFPQILGAYYAQYPGELMSALLREAAAAPADSHTGMYL